MGSAAVAIPRTAPESQLRHDYQQPAVILFAAYGLYVQGLMSPRALHAHFALIDMYQRRRIGGHKLAYIDPLEIARHLDSDDRKRNGAAVRQLLRLGFWVKTDVGFRPARELDHLRIDSRHIQALEAWIDDKGLNRRRILRIPRVMFENFPRLERGQLALNLDLLKRAQWEGDRDETTAIISLRVGDVAERWGLSHRTVQDVLHRQDLGVNIRLEAIDTPGWHRQKYGCRYRVIISKKTGNSASTLADPIPALTRLTTVPKAAEPEPDLGHEIASPEPRLGHEIAPPLILVFIPSYQSDLNTSNPPGAAENPGANQVGKQSKDKTDTETERATSAVVPAPTVAVNTEVSPQPLPNTETTTAVGPCTTDGETPARPSTPTAPTPSGPVSSPPTIDTAVDTKVSRPALPSVKSESRETLSKPDWRNLIDDDLHDMTRLDVLYKHLVECGTLRPSQRTRLDLVTAAVHARAGKNPCALFRNTVEEGHWERLTDSNEDLAHAMIRRHEQPPIRERHLHAVPKPTDPPPDPSDDVVNDVVIVAHVHKVLNEQQYTGNFFHWLKQTDIGRDWTRERWEKACDQAHIRRK